MKEKNNLKLNNKTYFKKIIISGSYMIFFLFIYEMIILLLSSIVGIYSVVLFFIPFIPFKFLLAHFNYYLFFIITIFCYFILGAIIGILISFLRGEK